MKDLRLALWLLTAVVACSRVGSATRDAGGGAPGAAESGGSSGPGGFLGTDSSVGSGSGGVVRAGTSDASVPAGGGGPTMASVSGVGGSSATNAAGRSADAGGITAGGSAAGGAGGSSAVCGVQVAHASRATPDVLLVLDRSATMNYDIAEDCVCTGSDKSYPPCPRTCKDRWSTLSAAISTTISSTSNVHWGLKLFYTPDYGGTAGDARATASVCAVSPQMEVPIGPDSGPAIMSIIQATVPEGSTPTRAAIGAASAYLKTVDDQSSKLILLATDGMPNCPAGGRSANGNDTAATEAAINAAGFPVYVLGIGPMLGALESFALAGGTGHYYPATSPEELAAALSAIAGAVDTCTFNFSPSPPNADNMAVYLDQDLIAKDNSNGWSFASDTRNIVLHGDACKTLKASTASTLTVKLTCPGTPP